MIENKDNETAESIKEKTNELQQASLKLFEAAYKKVSRDNNSWMLLVVILFRNVVLNFDVTSAILLDGCR